jgi:hypothetical protein
MAEQSKATVANAEALNNMMKKLKCKDEDMRELMERSNKGMLDLQKEILQLQADLKRKQLHSKVRLIHKTHFYRVIDNIVKHVCKTQQS